MKALPKFTTLSILLLVLTFTGCGSQIQTVQAAPAPVALSVPPNCGGQSCAGMDTKAWGYCQYETHQYGHSFTVSLEIGVSSNQTDPSNANCYLPLAGSGGIITSISGTVNYLPWTANVSSMVIRVNANGDGCNCGENSLYAAKLTAHGSPVSLPVNASFPAGVSVGQYIVVLVNDDLANAKPTTINLAFSGTLQ